MTFILKKTASLDSLNKQLLKRKKTKRFDAKKYLGKLKRGLDGLTYQQEQRNEW